MNRIVYCVWEGSEPNVVFMRLDTLGSKSYRNVSWDRLGRLCSTLRSMVHRGAGAFEAYYWGWLWREK